MEQKSKKNLEALKKELQKVKENKGSRTPLSLDAEELLNLDAIVGGIGSGSGACSQSCKFVCTSNMM